MTQIGYDFSNLTVFYQNLFAFIEGFYDMYLATTVDPWLPFVAFLAKILILVFIAGIFFILLRFRELNKEEWEKYRPIEVEQEQEDAHNVRWQVILTHAASDNSAEWKIAIIEADSILDELLQDAGYAGETMADRLKAAGESDTIQQAWEAHKVRNRIAHESGIELSRREVDTTIALYASVFKRMGFL